MEKSNKKITYIVIGILLVAVAGLSIAFAALSTTLNITFGNVTQDALTWNVHFKSGDVTGSASGTNDTTGRSCGTITISGDGLTATVGATTLSKPKDKCTWTLVVQNEGSIDATLNTISGVAPTGTNVSCTPSTITNTILVSETTNNTLLTTGGTLAKKSGSTPGTQTVYLVAEYLDNTTMSNSGGAITQSGAKFTLKYNQK